jgi:hypothetical protein
LDVGGNHIRATNIVLCILTIWIPRIGVIDMEMV